MKQLLCNKFSRHYKLYNRIQLDNWNERIIPVMPLNLCNDFIGKIEMGRVIQLKDKERHKSE